MSNFITGAELYSVRDRMSNEADMRSCLKSLKEMGYNSVQTAGHGADITLDMLVDMLKETGIDCTSTHMGFEWFEEHTEEAIAYHERLGCKYPGIGGLPSIYRADGAGYKEFARRANIVAAKFAEHGMKLVYHNHSFELERHPEGRGLEILVDNCSENVVFEIDVFWIQAGGMDPVDWIRRVAGRCDVVHFKDMKPVATITEIGNGNLDWAKIINECEKSGVKYAYIEQDNAVDGNSLESMRVSRENILKYGASF